MLNAIGCLVLAASLPFGVVAAGGALLTTGALIYLVRRR